MSNFVHLHNHTEYSLLDGLSAIKDLVSKAKEYGMPAIAITDHGNMFGAVKFYKECKAQGIKPIIGCEVYTAKRSMYDKTPEDKRSGHLVLLAENDTGYHNLIELVSDAYTDGFYYKPRVDRDLLQKHHEGLIALSACLAGDVQQCIIKGNYEKAKETALEFDRIFGRGNFFLELQDHKLQEDKLVNSSLLRMSKETGIPLVATNDLHYVEKEDARTQDVLLCMQTKSTVLDSNRYRFPSEEFYMKSPDEMRGLFSYAEEACNNTLKIAERCNVELEFGHYHIPAFGVPAPFNNTDEYFRHLCYEEFKERYPEANQELKDRLEYEMSTIEQMGFVEYFLIVWDYVNFAKNHGIMMGPARGSAAGSVVAYCLHISEVDPVKYSLFFERFLNPERVSMPDIDLDFSPRRRQEVIDYVSEKYGKDCVCRIATFIEMKPKLAVKDVARAMGLSFSEANEYSKLIPDECQSLQEFIDTDPDMESLFERDEKANDLFRTAAKIQNIPKTTSTHAAGVVISSAPIKTYVPITISDKVIATQYDKDEIEQLGLLKMDFLGLKNLNVIEDAAEMIRKDHGVTVDVSKLPLDDENVFKMLSAGHTSGVFQLESAGITDFMKKLKPSCFEDIVAGIALYRPGPMDSIPKYIENKKHPGKITYVDDHLASILDVTYGCIVYQEQVMQIVRDLAGYSLGRSDLVRKYMSKKKIEKMNEEKEYFINGKLDENGSIEIPGCIRNGISKEAAEEIWADMATFAEYAFNKSHAVAYAIITYQTAWLRCYYPSEFMAALMTNFCDKPDKLGNYIKNAKKITIPGTKRKIKMLPPDVNRSMCGFSAENGNIRFGLTAIRNVGNDPAADIVNAINKGLVINDIFDLCGSIEKKHLNAKVMEGLIKSGALKDIIPSERAAIKGIEEIIKFAKKSGHMANSSQINIFEYSQMDIPGSCRPELDDSLQEFDRMTLLSYEKEFLGSYITGSPLGEYRKELSKTNFKQEFMIDGQARKGIVTAGIVARVKTVNSKKGRMAFLTLEDKEENDIDIAVFSRLFAEAEYLLYEGSMIALKGDIDEKGRMSARQIVQLSDIAVLNIERESKRQIYGRTKNGQMSALCITASKKIMDSILPELERYRGRISVYWKNGENGKVYQVKGYDVRYDSLLQMKLEKAAGKENVLWKEG